MQGKKRGTPRRMTSVTVSPDNRLYVERTSENSGCSMEQVLRSSLPGRLNLETLDAIIFKKRQRISIDPKTTEMVDTLIKRAKEEFSSLVGIEEGISRSSIIDYFLDQARETARLAEWLGEDDLE